MLRSGLKEKVGERDPRRQVAAWSSYSPLYPVAATPVRDLSVGGCALERVEGAPPRKGRELGGPREDSRRRERESERSATFNNSADPVARGPAPKKARASPAP